jgi:hypothetical protein
MSKICALLAMKEPNAHLQNCVWYDVSILVEHVFYVCRFADLHR